MSPETKRSLIRNILQFIKLQLAGNVLFLGTYGGYIVADQVFHNHSIFAVAIPSILAHGLFFIVDKNWVFSEKTGKRKTGAEIVRFIAFMGMNYFINLGIIGGLQHYFGISPYIGQFIAATFFTFWTWAGLKFWVFRHGRHARPSALTIETKGTNAKRYAKYQHIEAKQKAKRAARLHR